RIFCFRFSHLLRPFLVESPSYDLGFLVSDCFFFGRLAGCVVRVGDGRWSWSTFLEESVRKEEDLCREEPSCCDSKPEKKNRHVRTRRRALAWPVSAFVFVPCRSLVGVKCLLLSIFFARTVRMQHYAVTRSPSRVPTESLVFLHVVVSCGGRGGKMDCK
ncbi:unnamed protein product, partial [Ectocarpus sp. 6 AP-2014]